MSQFGSKTSLVNQFLSSICICINVHCLSCYSCSIHFVLIFVNVNFYILEKCDNVFWQNSLNLFKINCKICTYLFSWNSSCTMNFKAFNLNHSVWVIILRSSFTVSTVTTVTTITTLSFIRTFSINIFNCGICWCLCPFTCSCVSRTNFVNIIIWVTKNVSFKIGSSTTVTLLTYSPDPKEPSCTITFCIWLNTNTTCFFGCNISSIRTPIIRIVCTHSLFKHEFYFFYSHANLIIRNDSVGLSWFCSKGSNNFTSTCCLDNPFHTNCSRNSDWCTCINHFSTGNTKIKSSSSTCIIKYKNCFL